HLLAKAEHQVKDEGGQEEMQETVYADYKEIEGMKHAMKLTIKRAGKLYEESEIQEYRFHDRLDDSTSAMPSAVGPVAVVRLRSPDALGGRAWPRRKGGSGISGGDVVLASFFGVSDFFFGGHGVFRLKSLGSGCLENPRDLDPPLFFRTNAD